MAKAKYTSKTTANRREIELSLKEFSRHWSSQIAIWKRDGSGRSAERKYAHQFWLDLLSCFGYNGARLDLFEVDAARFSTNRAGRIDAFLPGIFIGEIKSLHVPIKKAEAQILDYLHGGTIIDRTYPLGAIATNFSEFYVWRPKHGKEKVSFLLQDIAKNFDVLSFLLPDVQDEINARHAEEQRDIKEKSETKRITEQGKDKEPRKKIDETCAPESDVNINLSALSSGNVSQSDLKSVRFLRSKAKNQSQRHTTQSGRPSPNKDAAKCPTKSQASSSPLLNDEGKSSTRDDDSHMSGFAAVISFIGCAFILCGVSAGLGFIFRIIFGI